MRSCSITFAAIATVLSTLTVQAGDSWQQCAMMVGDLYEYDGEVLYEVNGDDRTEVAHTKSQSITIEETAGYCEIKSGARFNWANHVYVVRLDIAGTEGPFNLWAMCEEGGSGIPATEGLDTTCVKNVYTKNRQVVPSYVDKAVE